MVEIAQKMTQAFKRFGGESVRETRAQAGGKHLERIRAGATSVCRADG